MPSGLRRDWGEGRPPRAHEKGPPKRALIEEHHAEERATCPSLQASRYSVMLSLAYICRMYGLWTVGSQPSNRANGVSLSKRLIAPTEAV